jgi:hypothetical protein
MIVVRRRGRICGKRAEGGDEAATREGRRETSTLKNLLVRRETALRKDSTALSSLYRFAPWKIQKLKPDTRCTS